MQHVMRDRRASEKGAEESRQADDQRFAPLGFEDCGIEFRAGEKREHDGPGSGQKRDPLRVAEQPALAPRIRQPMTSWATVPTTISESAVEILNQIASSVAASASPTHSADKAQVFVMNANSSIVIQGTGRDMTPQQDSLSGVIICPAYWMDSG